MNHFDLYRSLDLLPGIVLGLTVHEAAHAWMALRLGDTTAKNEGRVSLDPFRHLDWLGLLVLFVAGFGWAKPVRFDPEQLKNPQTDPKWIAAAGPLSNVILAVLLSAVYAVVKHAVPLASSSFDAAIMRMLSYAVVTNWGLAVFNMIPLPPLDGSHIVFPEWKKTPQRIVFWNRWGTGILFAVVLVQNQTSWTILPIGPIVSFLAHGVWGWFGIASAPGLG
jgi:Zn-dependent protease